MFGHPTLSRPVKRCWRAPTSRSSRCAPRAAGPTGRSRSPPSTTRSAPTGPSERPGWLDEWRQADRSLGDRIDAFVAEQPGLTPYDVAAAVNAANPPGGLLFVGASNPIRDLDLMATAHPVGERRMVLANRGLAGIDGTVSSAIGAALGRPHSPRAIAYVGDVTFLHDATALVIGPDEAAPGPDDRGRQRRRRLDLRDARAGAPGARGLLRAAVRHAARRRPREPVRGHPDAALARHRPCRARARAGQSQRRDRGHRGGRPPRQPPRAGRADPRRWASRPSSRAAGHDAVHASRAHAGRDRRGGHRGGRPLREVRPPLATGPDRCRRRSAPTCRSCPRSRWSPRWCSSACSRRCCTPPPCRPAWSTSTPTGARSCCSRSGWSPSRPSGSPCWCTRCCPTSAGRRRFAIGAVVAPPDAVAATAIGRRIGLPRRIVTILEGESLLNDATALVALRTAIAAAHGRRLARRSPATSCSPRVAASLVGLAVLLRDRPGPQARHRPGHRQRRCRFLTPFAAYVAAEEIHASGVISVVVAGLLLGHKSPILQTAQSRIAERMNWRSIAFLLESSVFLLIGLQARTIIGDAVGGERDARAGSLVRVRRDAGRRDRAAAGVGLPRALPARPARARPAPGGSRRGPTPSCSAGPACAAWSRWRRRS